MIKHKESHMDHGFTQEQWDYIFKKFEGRDAFFIETFELPENLGTVMNELYGPSCGDPPIPESEVYYMARGDRAWVSRMVIKLPRPTRFVRVIAGPHDGHPCVLYTAYGVASIDTPNSPKEIGDLEAQRRAYENSHEPGPDGYVPVVGELRKLYEQLSEANDFWATHALADR